MKPRFVVPLGLAVALAGAAFALPRQGSAPLLPNLQPWPGSMQDYFVDKADAKKLLRFSAGVVNAGPGPLELQGISKRPSSTLPEYQVFYPIKGKATMQPVGQCV